MSLTITSWRIAVAAWKNFARNIWLALTTVFVLVLALLSVNVLVGVNVLLTNAVTMLENKIDVSVYFKQGTPQAVLEQAKFFMTSLPQVKSAELLSADRALESFKQKHANDPKILAALTELEQNPLGASLVLKAKNTSDYHFLLEALRNPQFDFAIESKNFDDHAETINQVRDISKSVKFFGLVLILIFALFSILIVYNTIRVAIYTQREEIGIMRLVGASSTYVRLPFVLEGIILALFALVVCSCIVITAAFYFDPRLMTAFGGTNPGLVDYFKNQVLLLAAIEGGGLSFLVGISSWAAAGKYLKR
ncbi:MAG: permease-like cell division protein FtsX [Patescibacteria group bacterium]